jgi:hypothetical protein
MKKLLSLILFIGLSCSFFPNEPLPDQWYNLTIVNNYDFECWALCGTYIKSGPIDDRKCEYRWQSLKPIPPNSAYSITLLFQPACSIGDISINIYKVDSLIHNADSLIYQTKLPNNGEDKTLTIPN